MKRLSRIAFVFSILLVLVRCGWLPPFETAPPSAPAGESEAVRVAICYNGLTASKVRVRDVAAQSCGPGSNPRRIARDLNHEHCPLLIPERATFACPPPSEGAAPASAPANEGTAPAGAAPSEGTAPAGATPSEGTAPTGAGNNQR
jgi:hypothetical protein